MALVPYILSLLITFFILGFVISSQRFRRLVGLSKASDSATRDRSPILYLRSFREDKTEDVFRYSGTRHEELLVSVLDEVGEVIAIADPTQKIRPGGATRMIVRSGDWKQEVTDLMKRAQLVVIQVEISEGLVWEIMTAVKNLPPERILFSLPYRLNNTKFLTTDNQELPYDLFRIEMRDILPVPLPPRKKRARYLCFDSDWTPKLLYPPHPLMELFILSHQSRVGIRETLRPFFRQRGVSLSRRLTIFKVLSLISIPVLPLVFLFWVAVLSGLIGWVMVGLGLL